MVANPVATSCYYNDQDPFCVDWLCRLRAAGQITAGEIDGRSIRELRAADVAGKTRAHFFAGIGGWDLALRLAGWPADRAVWTGSCPCQPFSYAGRKRGTADERHLWPEWFRLIRECHPPIILGEQVASPAGLAWLDAVSADLEGEGYAFGAADLCAAGVGAPHVRQRLYFVAVAGGGRCEGVDALLRPRQSLEDLAQAAGGGDVGELAIPGSARLQGPGVCGDGADSAAARADGVVDDGGQGLAAWTACDWLPCLDGKTRPVEPGTFPLAPRLPARVGRLRAYGNAVVPQVAATFARAVMEVTC